MGVGSDASPGAVPAAEVGSGQYPSLIVDWGQTRVGGGGGAGPAFEATLLLNNTNVQVRFELFVCLRGERGSHWAFVLPAQARCKQHLLLVIFGW